MDDDFVDVFPSADGVGDSPVKTDDTQHLVSGHSWSRPPMVSLSIPGLDTGGAAAAVSPALPGFRGVATPSPAKESVLRSARGTREDSDLAALESPAASPHFSRSGMAPALTIDPGGECVPTELDKKRAKLEKFRYECSEVSDSFLYVSGEDAAKQQGVVCNKGITHIINCAGPQCPNYLEYTGRFKFLRLDFYDHRTEDVAWFIYSAFDFMRDARTHGGRVLVHCVQGVSRSCTLAIAWLMLTDGVDYDEAYLRVRQGRPICAPNTGFICSLLEWQRRRQQPPTAPFLYRTAWHVPLFPHDLLLKICLHEEDRNHVVPSLSALDPRGCFLLVASRTTARPPFRSSDAPALRLANGSGTSHISPSTSAMGPVSFSTLTPGSAAARAAAAAAAAAVANAKAVAAVAAAEEAKARAAAAAAEEAVMVAKAVEAGVAIPPSWRDSELVARDDRGTPPLKLDLGAQAPLPPEPLTPKTPRFVRGLNAAGSKSAAAWADKHAGGVGKMNVSAVPSGTEVDVFIWRGSQSHPQMLTLAKTGARWLREYENWGAAADAPIVEEGQESPALLRHLMAGGVGDARDPPVYGDLSRPSPPPTAARASAGHAFMPCPTPSAHAASRAPALSPAEAPTLSPAGPSPSPGGVSFSPYGCGVSPAGVIFECPQVSPAGSTAVSPATQGRTHRGGPGAGDSRHNSLTLRCSLASATEDMDEEEEGENTMLGGFRAGNVAVEARGAAGARSRPRLYELADELGGQGASGLRWSELSIFDDQDLLPQCCFLLVSPGGGTNFLWVGEAFAAAYAQGGDLQEIQALALDVARRDARRGSDRLLPSPADVEAASVVPGDGSESQEWWTAFESGYA